MAKVSNLEQMTWEAEILEESDIQTILMEARRLLKLLCKPLHFPDSRKRRQQFEPLISDEDYEMGLQSAWDLLGHPEDSIARVGYDLLHRLKHYELVELEYAFLQNQQTE